MFSHYSKIEILEDALKQQQAWKAQQTTEVLRNQALLRHYEIEVQRQREYQINLEKEIHALSLEMTQIKQKSKLKREELSLLDRESLESQSESLDLEIARVEENNHALKEELKLVSVKSKPDTTKLRTPVLQEQIKHLKEEILNLERSIKQIDEECLSLQLGLKTRVERKKFLKEEHDVLSKREDDIKENLSMIHVLDMNISELQDLFYMTRNKEFQVFLHWNIAWAAYFNQEIYQAANHFFMAMHLNPKTYQTDKLKYIEAYLKTKDLWFEDAKKNYDYYLRLKYGSKPCPIEVLIFWANRVIYSDDYLSFSHEMFSDLIEYSARQNDWYMVDQTYSAMSMISYEYPLFLCHLLAIVKSSCEYVDSLFLQDDQDSLYLYYLPKMMASNFYQQHIKPIKPEFWNDEERKVADYHPTRPLSHLEEILLKFHLKSEGKDNKVFDPQTILDTRLPEVLRCWILFTWVKSLIEQGIMWDAGVVLNYGIKLFPQFKELSVLQKSMKAEFSVLFFTKSDPSSSLNLSLMRS